VASGTDLWRGNLEVVTAPFVFAPDGRTVASIVNLQVRVVEVVGREERLHIDAQAGGSKPVTPQSLAFAPDGRVLAVGSLQGEVLLYDLPSGKELGRFKGHRGGVAALAFSPDGARLASGGVDATVLVWDAANLVKKNRPAIAVPKDADIAALWDDLAGRGDKAHRALWALTAAPQKSVEVFQEKLKAAPSLDPMRIAKLIAALDDESYDTRQKATETLGALPEAEPEMQKALANNPSAEMQRRLKTALGNLEGATATPPDQVREARAVEVLEILGTPEAKQLLEKLAKGAESAPLTQDCRAALARLAKKAPASR
jgi:WD domain, G-beta repeat